MFPTERTGRQRGVALTALFAFLGALFLTSAHPVGLQPATDHECVGSVHLSSQSGPAHDEDACVLCELGRTPTLAPDVVAPPPIPAASLDEALVALPSGPRVPSLLGHHPRDPPA